MLWVTRRNSREGRQIKGIPVKKVTELVVAAFLAMLGTGGAFAQGAPEWQDVRIGTLDSWILETDMVVRRFVLQDVPYESFGNFVGVAYVEFTNRSATEYESGVNRTGLVFISDTVLRPGTVIHLDALDLLIRALNSA